MNSLLRTSQKIRRLRSRSKPLLLPGTIIKIGLFGGLPILLLSLIGNVTFTFLFNRHKTDQLRDRLAASAGGLHVLFLVIAAVTSVSLIANGQPAYAHFGSAKDAASSGTSTYIGKEESDSLIDTITLGMWALAAVSGIATIADDAIQNVLVQCQSLILG